MPKRLKVGDKLILPREASCSCSDSLKEAARDNCVGESFQREGNQGRVLQEPGVQGLGKWVLSSERIYSGSDHLQDFSLYNQGNEYRLPHRSGTQWGGGHTSPQPPPIILQRGHGGLCVYSCWCSIILSYLWTFMPFELCYEWRRDLVKTRDSLWIRTLA